VAAMRFNFSAAPELKVHVPESVGELGFPVATAQRISYESKPCHSGG
jgi:hypothetical protein